MTLEIHTYQASYILIEVTSGVIDLGTTNSIICQRMNTMRVSGIVMAIELFRGSRENDGITFKIDHTRNIFENTIGWYTFLKSLVNGAVGQCLNDGSIFVSVEGILHTVLPFFFFLFFFLILYTFELF